MSKNEEFLLTAEKEFKKLFAAAKEKDELHFVLSLSPESRPYKINTALDARKAFDDYVTFLQENDKSPIHARIALALYSHISEASGFWEVPKNLLSIIDGNKYDLMPFSHLVKKFGSPEGSIAPNANKVMRSLMAYSKELGFHELADVFKNAFDPDIRNGFAHADYALIDRGICVGSRYDSERIISWEEFNELLHRAVNFYKTFMLVLSENLKHYSEPKIIKGYLTDKEPESTWEIHYEEGGSFTITGGVGYEPKSA